MIYKKLTAASNSIISSVRTDKMIDEKFLKKQKAVIEKEIARLKAQEKSAGEFSEMGSSSDDSVLEFEEFEEKLALNKNTKKDIGLLESALKRIENGKYGRCLKCEEIIEEGRLEVYPEAEYCATHAKEK